MLVWRRQLVINNALNEQYKGTFFNLGFKESGKRVILSLI